MSSSYAPCAACKYLRRKCTQECVFAPYFPPDNPQKFINVHKVFGASNVGKILMELNPNQRNDAVNSLAYEAECRIKDPIYGCVGFVSLLQHHLRQVQQEIDRAKRELATYIGPAALQPMLMNNPAAIFQQQQQNLDPTVNYHHPQTAPFQGQVMIQDQQPDQQLAAMAREQEMLRAYAQQQQQQQEQLYLQQMQQQQQQQELYAQQQQRMQQQQEMYVQQQQDDLMRFNDAGDPSAASDFVQIPAAAMGSFENQAYQYQVLQQEQQQQQQHGLSHHHHHQQQQQQLQIDHELMLQQQQQQQHLQLMPQHFGPHSQQQQQGERDGSDEERSFGPL